MDKIRVLVLSLMLPFFICGCTHIVVGGTGKIGTVSTGGSIAIPLPKAGK